MKKDTLEQWFKEHMAFTAECLGKHPSEVMWNEFQSFVYSNVEDVGTEWAQGLKNLGGFTNLRDSIFRPKIKGVALVVKAKAKAAKVQAVKDANKELMVSSMEDVLNKIRPGQPGKLPTRTKYLERNHHLLVSDTHFGSDSAPESGSRAYGVKEEARSFAKIVVETAEYKRQYKKNTKLIVNLTGDIIQGEIHDARNYAEVSKQSARAINILCTGIDLLAKEYPEVEINAVSGNHDRYLARHGTERAFQGKDDSHAFVIYYAIKKYFSKYPNVKMNIPLSSTITYQSLGSHFYGTHGDTHIHLPNPSGVINTGNLENQINRLNSRLNGPKYSVVFCGHIHTGMLLHLSNNVVLITNPPLIPTDEFGLSLNIDPDAPTGQWLWESVEGHAVGDSRFLRVTESDRQDSSLDKVIPVDL